MGLAVAIALVGPLALFNPWFVSLEQARNGVPGRLATTQAEVDRVTGAMLCDLVFGCDDFSERIDPSTPLLTDAERGHMRDVAHLVRALWVVLLIAIGLVIASLVALRREPRRAGIVMVWTSAGVGIAAIAAGGFFAIDFDQAFLAFHELFFPQGNFLFGPDSNLLRLFPEGFWFESALVAGLLIVLSCAAVTLVGWRLARR
jgi:integral membrane protein (TIGR01906 family)